MSSGPRLIRFTTDVLIHAQKIRTDETDEQVPYNKLAVKEICESFAYQLCLYTALF